MRISGVGRPREQWGRLRGRLSPGPTILTYHRVAKIPQDPHLLAVAPEHFEEQLQGLRRSCHVVSLRELAESLTMGRSPGAVVAVTFDDGYADMAQTALPLLVKHKIPATFYLTPGFVGTTREQLHDDLERLVLLSSQCPEQLHLKVAGKVFVWAMHSKAKDQEISALHAGWNLESKTDPLARHRAHREIHNLLRISTPVEREKALEELRTQCGDPGPARPTHRAMSWDETRQLAAYELADVGAHTMNHVYLSAMPLNEQGAEILESKRILEEQIGHPVTSFAYPYGTHKSYTVETVDLVKQLGFATACSNFRGRIGRRTDLFQLPRFVVRDWDGDEFMLQLRSGRL